MMIRPFGVRPFRNQTPPHVSLNFIGKSTGVLREKPQGPV
jgi:hypothetical protein